MAELLLILACYANPAWTDGTRLTWDAYPPRADVVLCIEARRGSYTGWDDWFQVECVPATTAWYDLPVRATAGVLGVRVVAVQIQEDPDCSGPYCKNYLPVAPSNEVCAGVNLQFF